MLKVTSVVTGLMVAGVAAAGLTAGCGGGDDKDGTGAANGGQNPIGFGGASNQGDGGAVLIFGGTSATGGIPGSGAANGFDGGLLPITPEQKKLVTESACAGFLTEGETLPSVLQLVVDTSSSMRNMAPGSNNLSKWDVTRDALLDAIVGANGSSGLPASVAVGMLFYPNVEYQVKSTPQPLEACVNTSALVPIELLGAQGAPHRNRIGGGISQVQLAQSTPTDDAYTYALESSLLPTKAIGKKFMLLITDGTPTLEKGCMNSSGSLNDVDPSPIVEEITVAAREDVKTFLIGSPGSEANRTWMSRAAVIGGTATPGCNVNGPNYCHMDMTTAPDFAAALRAGLARVVGQITPCTFTFAEPPAGQTIDANNINVVINSGGQSSLVIRDDIGTCAQGWQLTADQEILLCPDTCAQVKSDSGASVDVVFGCGSFTEVPVK